MADKTNGFSGVASTLTSCCSFVAAVFGGCCLGPCVADEWTFCGCCTLDSEEEDLESSSLAFSFFSLGALCLSPLCFFCVADADDCAAPTISSGFLSPESAFPGSSFIFLTEGSLGSFESASRLRGFVSSALTSFFTVTASGL